MFCAKNFFSNDPSSFCVGPNDFCHFFFVFLSFERIFLRFRNKSIAKRKHFVLLIYWCATLWTRPDTFCWNRPNGRFFFPKSTLSVKTLTRSLSNFFFRDNHRTLIVIIWFKKINGLFALTGPRWVANRFFFSSKQTN